MQSLFWGIQLATLNLPENRKEAAEAIRGLVEKTTISPKAAGDGVDIGLHGNLAGILTFAAGNKSKFEKIELILKVVSMGEGCDRLTSDIQTVMVAGQDLNLRLSGNEPRTFIFHILILSHRHYPFSCF